MNLIFFVGCSSSGQTPLKCKRIFYITSRFFYRPAQKKSFSRRHDALWEAQMTPEEAALKQWDRHRQVLFQRNKTLYVSYGNDSKCAVFPWYKSMFYVPLTCSKDFKIFLDNFEDAKSLKTVEISTCIWDPSTLLLEKTDKRASF